MNEWEWQRLEDKTPGRIARDSWASKSGEANASGCARALAAMSSISRSQAKSRPSNPSSRITKASCTCASLWTTIPVRDIGLMRQPGHRFFFAPSEVEACSRWMNRITAMPGKRDTDRRNRQHFSGGRWVRRRSRQSTSPSHFSARCSCRGLRHPRLRSRVRPDGRLRDHHSRGRLSR